MLKIIKYLGLDFLKNFFVYLIIFAITIYLFKLTIFPHGLNLEDKSLTDIILILANVPILLSLFILFSKIEAVIKKDREKGFYKANKDILVRGDLNLVFQEIKNYIKSKNYFVFKEDDSSMILKYFTKSKYFSYGEIMRIEIIKGDSGFVVINASSKNVGFYKSLDWGKNKRNIKMLEKSLAGINQI